jgi:2-polyprenyl-3-methyl-5-hydroxy-6-metoxy-1,4-benzoquinol methylase
VTVARRTVEPELLDDLPASDPKAIHSRRDLQKVNLFMGHSGILTRSLRGTIAGARVLELGAGDGTLLLNVAKRLGRQTNPVRAVLVDRQPSISAETRAEFDAAGWHVEIRQTDVFEWLERSDQFDITIANLFLHHFRERELIELLRQVSEHTRQFVACEPLRSRAAATGASLLRFVGCNGVTLHDARASVRAGFRDRELSALWPRNRLWRVAEGRSGLFTHTFMATHAV